jgi:Tol biopolymer transport system component
MICLRLLAGAALSAAPAAAQSTVRVSVDSLGLQGNLSSRDSGVSADGRFVAFTSNATNLVPGDTNGGGDVFVRDCLLGLTTRVSVDSAGALGNQTSAGAPISADGRFVVFTSNATNLVAGDTNGVADIFVHDRLLGTTVRASVDSAGVQGDDFCHYPALSADGRIVAFSSDAGNLAPGDTHAFQDVFVHDLQTGITTRVSVDSAGAEANGRSWNPALSADGRYVAFPSLASNLVAGDTNAAGDIFVHDCWTGITTRVSVGALGAQANAVSDRPSISADGRYVAFESLADNLVALDTNGALDVFVRDLVLGTTERASVDFAGVQANAGSSAPSLSADGRTIAFQSLATNLVPGDGNGCADTFVRDRVSGAIERANVDSAGLEANASCSTSTLSATGRFVAFTSSASNLVTGDTNGVMDVFLRDRGPAGPGTDLCQAGVAGVIACPCSNPPGGAPRGCDNSAATGGAQLTSSGSSSLAADTLVLLTHGETPAATSIVLQGDAELAGGVVFGQGVRCAGGALKRLYVKGASGGSITAPGPGDPSVSARSAALGDPIGAGTGRWYAVHYRDPLVLGGCPAASTFDVTQTQLVGWTP